MSTQGQSTGQVIGQIVGATAGFIITGGNPMGAAWAAQGEMMAGSLVEPVEQNTEPHNPELCSEYP